MKVKRCIALAHSDAHEELWTPCGEIADRGAVLCRDHREALAGVFLGLLEHPAAEGAPGEEEAFREAMRLGASYFARRYWQGKARQKEWRADRAGSPPAAGGSIRHD